jgi:hypothetical protein
MAPLALCSATPMREKRARSCPRAAPTPARRASPPSRPEPGARGRLGGGGPHSLAGPSPLPAEPLAAEPLAAPLAPLAAFPLAQHEPVPSPSSLEPLLGPGGMSSEGLPGGGRGRGGRRGRGAGAWLPGEWRGSGRAPRHGGEGVSGPTPRSLHGGPKPPLRTREEPKGLHVEPGVLAGHYGEVLHAHLGGGCLACSLLGWGSEGRGCAAERPGEARLAPRASSRAGRPRGRGGGHGLTSQAGRLAPVNTCTHTHARTHKHTHAHVPRTWHPNLGTPRHTHTPTFQAPQTPMRGPRPTATHDVRDAEAVPHDRVGALQRLVLRFGVGDGWSRAWGVS